MTQLTQQLRARLYARASEREQIARDLHDTFFQSIQGLLLRFNTAASRLDIGHPVRRMFDEALKQSDQVMAEGRELLVHLHAASSEANDLPATLADYGEQLQKVRSVDFKVAVNGGSSSKSCRESEMKRLVMLFGIRWRDLSKQN